MKENLGPGKADGVVESVKTEHIKNLEEQFKVLDERLGGVLTSIDEIETFKKDKLAEDEKMKDKKVATVDVVDGKIQSVYEKLKNENQMIWKDSVSLAEKQFNEKGISETIDLLPTSL